MPFLVWEQIAAPKAGETERPKSGSVEPGKFYGEHRKPVDPEAEEAAARKAEV